MALGDIFNLPTYASSLPTNLPPLPSNLGGINDHIMDSNTYEQYKAQQAVQAENYKWLKSDTNVHTKALLMLKMRLAGLDSKFHLTPDEFLTCYVADGIVYIFFVINGKAGVTQEEIALFPSDKLITQFRLIR